MVNLIKNVLYAGTGMVAMTTEKTEELVNELIEKGKVNDNEGRKIINKFWKQTQDKRADFESKVATGLEELKGRFDNLTGQDVEGLEKRIKSLEVKVGMMTKQVEKLAGAKPKKVAAK